MTNPSWVTTLTDAATALGGNLMTVGAAALTGVTLLTFGLTRGVSFFKRLASK